jgi:hypothetical protein
MPPLATVFFIEALAHNARVLMSTAHAHKIVTDDPSTLSVLDVIGPAQTPAKPIP